MNARPMKARRIFNLTAFWRTVLFAGAAFLCLPLFGTADPANKIKFDTTLNAQTLAVDATRNRLYLGTGSSPSFLVYALDAGGVPGPLISSGSPGVNYQSLAVDAVHNRLYAASSSATPLYIFTLDAAGNTSAVNSFGYFSTNPATALALNGTRQCLYVGLSASPNGLGLVRLNAASGDPASTAEYATNQMVYALALDEARHKLYLGCAGGALRVFNLNAANGDPTGLTAGSPYAAGSSAIYSLALDSVRNRLYAVSGMAIYAFTLQTGGDPGEPNAGPAVYNTGVYLNSLTLDAAHSRLYVGSDSGSNDLRWMDLDGLGNLSGSLSTVAGSGRVYSLALDFKRQRLYTATSGGSDYYQLTDPALTPLWINGGEASTAGQAVSLHLCAPNAEFIRFDSSGLQDFYFPITLSAGNATFDQWISARNGFWSNDGGVTHALTLTVQADLSAGAGSKTVGVWFWESSGGANVNGVLRHEQVSINLVGGSPTDTPTLTFSPTWTPTLTTTPTPSTTPTVTPSGTPSRTVTGTASITPSSSPSPTITPTPTLSVSATSMPTGTPSSTPTVTASFTGTITMSPSSTPSGSPTGSMTPSVTGTPSATRSATATFSATTSATLTSSVTATATFSVTPYFSPTQTPTRTATFTPTPTLTVSATRTPTATITLTLPPTFTPTPAAELFLDKNHFSPLREHLGIKLGVTEPGEINLEIFSLTGRKVWGQSAVLPPGYLALDWDGRNAAGDTVGSGVYFVVLESGGRKRFVRKVLVIK
ncbi:MAG: hypothetical protein HGA76_03230 [Candidatus Firestonebacteria bacterium]|nr:hypothetical protein [Candidatus Firestonebacteria bacterium]